MRLFILPFIFLTFITSCDSQKYDIEDKLYECLKNEYKNRGINLDLALDSLENLFISENKLKSSNGNAKLEYYKSIAKTGEAPTLTDTYLTKRIKDNYVDETYLFDCLLNQMDSSTFLNSNFYLQSQKVSEQVGLNVTIQSVANAISQTFTTKDLEHPFYRSHMLISFLMIADKEQAYIRTIPKKVNLPSFGEKEEATIDISNFPKLRFLWGSNGGLIGYYSDGTVRNCPKCDLITENLEYMENAEISGYYVFENDCIIEKNKERLCIDTSKLNSHPFWIVVNFKWLVEI